MSITKTLNSVMQQFSLSLKQQISLILALVASIIAGLLLLSCTTFPISPAITMPVLSSPTPEITPTANSVLPTSSSGSSAPQGVISSFSPTMTSLSDEAVSFIDNLPLWLPDIQWQESEPSTQVTRDPYDKVPLGTRVSGVSRTGTGISPMDLIPYHPQIHEELTRQGWQITSTGAAPGGSSYRYTKTEQGKQRIIDLDYVTKAAVVSGPGEPIQFAQCPCPYKLTVFYSDPF